MNANNEAAMFINYRPWPGDVFIASTPVPGRVCLDVLDLIESMVKGESGSCPLLGAKAMLMDGGLWRTGNFITEAMERINAALLSYEDSSHRDTSQALARRAAESDRLHADSLHLITQKNKEIDELKSLLREAVQDISDWGSYASEYFKDKHDLAGTIAKYEAIFTTNAQDGL